MYQLGQVGERFRIIAQKGRSAQCPPGTSTESSGRLGTGQQYAWCYRAPVFAPPPVTTYTYAPVTTTTVPTAVTTAISPQISPTMAQQQASPGAAVTAQPVSAPAPVSGAATVPTGITEAQLRDILSAQAAAVEAERAAEERKSQVEMETMRREIALRERASQEIDLARRADEARRIDADRFAREQAEADAIASAAAIPPPPSTMYAPTGGGGFPMPSAPALPPPEMAMEARDVTITQDGDAEIPWALIAIAAAGIGAVVLVGGKGRKRKRGKK